MFLKLITIDITKIHIRYEDDFYSGKDPYSFGIILDSFKIYNYQKDITFDEPLDIKYEEIWPIETDGLHLKKIECNDVRIYWNSKSPAYIPDSLMEDTRESRDQIFEAMNADTIHQLMTAQFINQDHNSSFQRYNQEGAVE
jgi:hypothetical protein